jgi:hypothetical protein
MEAEIFRIHQGNPGAISVVRRVTDENAFNVFALMEYANKTAKRGSDLWVDFKEHGKDVDKFMQRVRETVNWD